MPTAPRVDAPQQSAFEVERFDFDGDDRLQVTAAGSASAGGASCAPC